MDEGRVIGKRNQKPEDKGGKSWIEEGRKRGRWGEGERMDRRTWKGREISESRKGRIEKVDKRKEKGGQGERNEWMRERSG